MTLMVNFFVSRPLRILVATAAVLALTLGAADARPGGGGSAGSRGARTFSAPPPTATAPNTAAPMERTITQPSAPRPGINAPAPMPAPAAAPSFGRSLMGGLLGGFIGAGLFGMLSGHGFMGGMGGFASILGLLLQAGLIVLLIGFVVRMFRNRQEPALAGAMPTGSHYSGPAPGAAMGGGAGPANQDIVIGPQDYAVFERLLTEVQEAYSNEDLGALRRLATPEMVSYFGEDLARNSARGVVDRVSNVKLLQGDLSEAWREDGTEYATVAMRFSLINVMIQRGTDRVVEGNPTVPQQVTELWTFRRPVGGGWMLSAIQQS
jgi:predicted lipid-binding transport protein (Tim44 family)